VPYGSEQAAYVAPYQQELGRFRRRVVDQAPEDRPAFVAVERGAGRHVHDGLYLRFSAGLGYASLAGSTQPFGYAVQGEELSEPAFDGAAGGFAYSTQLALGGAVARGAMLALGVSSVTLPQATATEPVVGLGDYTYAISQSVQVGPLIDVYPDPGAGFHFGGGVGVAGIIVGQADPALGPRARSHTTLGWGAAAMVGYEWWVADDWSTGILLRLEYVRGSGDDPRGNAWVHHVWAPSVGFGLTYN